MSFPTSHDPTPTTSESLQLFNFQLKTKQKKIIISMCIHKQVKKGRFTDPWLCLLELWITADLFIASAHQASQSTERISRLILINKTTVCTLKCHIKTPSVAFQHLKHTFRSQYFPWHLCTCLSLHNCSLLASIRLLLGTFILKPLTKLARASLQYQAHADPTDGWVGNAWEYGRE